MGTYSQSVMYNSLLGTSLLLCVHTAANTERDLTQRLLQDYHTSARPVLHESDADDWDHKRWWDYRPQDNRKAVNVTIGLTLQDIIEVDDNSITATIWLNLQWVDRHLVW